MLKFRRQRNEVLGRLGIDDLSVLQNVPRVTHLLSEAEEGLPQVLQALRASGDEDARLFVEKYDSVAPGEIKRRGISWEEISVACGIGPRRLLEVAMWALKEDREAAAAIIRATSLPLVVKKSVQMGLHDRGIKDRRMLFEASGFVPVPSGSVVVNRFTAATQINTGETEVKAEVHSGELPEMEDDLKAIQGLLLGQGDVR